MITIAVGLERPQLVEPKCGVHWNHRHIVNRLTVAFNGRLENANLIQLLQPWDFSGYLESLD